MNFQDYQLKAWRTVNKTIGFRDQLANLGLGLAGEAGEVVDLLKKHLFHGHELDHREVVDELGDLLWYLANLAYILDLPLELIASQNVDKLLKRYPDGFDPERSQHREV